ncbi:hypothetical protein Bca4012_081601 [Brassica carinata]|uniref:Uncharacterized protein n=1 Tax=Brassica carinata TaxID=52824 RepID=A0A8X8ARA6_BRACI|nr:hypothetical protein Bca52824_029161 [Brassica carinata]
MFAFLAVVALIPGASTPTSPNPSDSTPSGSMAQRDSELLDNSTLPMQSNTSPSAPAHPTGQPGYESDPIPQPYLRRPIHPSLVGQSQHYMSPSSSAHPGQNDDMIPPPYFRHPSSLTQRQNNASSSSSAHPAQPGENDDRIPSRYFRNPFSTSSDQSQSNSNPLLPVSQRPSESTTRVPWYHGNAFYAVERASHGIPPNEFHIMDHLSSSVIQYVFAWGINFTSQRPNLDTSIYIQAFLNQVALSLFLLANAVFPRTHPVLAFILDRLSFLLIVISTYLASLYMFPPYVAIIMFLVVATIYMFSHFRR